MQKFLKPLTLGAAMVALIGSSTVVAQDEEKIDFEKQIWPFVKKGCVECHQPEYEYEISGRTRLKKPKGGLIITDKESFLKGSVDREGNATPVIVPGKPEDSSFHERTTLDIYDDDHMPPTIEEGVPAPGEWTDEQKDLFAKWIAQGADFGEWTMWSEEPGWEPEVEEKE